MCTVPGLCRKPVKLVSLLSQDRRGARGKAGGRGEWNMILSLLYTLQVRPQQSNTVGLTFLLAWHPINKKLLRPASAHPCARCWGLNCGQNRSVPGQPHIAHPHVSSSVASKADHSPLSPGRRKGCTKAATGWGLST
jgi:hypothetical protein